MSVIEATLPANMDSKAIHSVQCLLCQKWFSSVGHHVAKKHGISARDYKLHFGLRLTVGIMSENTQAKFSQKAHSDHDLGRMKASVSRLSAGASLANIKAKYAFTEIQHEKNRTLGRKLIDRRHLIEEVIRRIENGDRIAIACRTTQGLTWDTFHRHIKFHKDLMIRYNKIRAQRYRTAKRPLT